MLELMDYCACQKKVICKIERASCWTPLICDLSCCPFISCILTGNEQIKRNRENHFVCVESSLRRRDES